MPQDRRCCWTPAEAEEGVPSEGMQALRFWLSWRANIQSCLRFRIRLINLADFGRKVPALLVGSVVLTRVLNFGDADA